MDWTEIKIKVKAEDAEAASDIANMVVPYGIYIEDYSDLVTAAPEIAHIDLIDEDLLAKDRSFVFIHIYMDEKENALESVEFLRERFNAENIFNEITSIGISDTDWAENWKKYFKPTEIGNRLVVCPSWEEYKGGQNRIKLINDPGAAFGTGTHATTSMCLYALDKYISGNETVLDVGCGSGILAIAGVLLGAKSAVGVDIDAQSVKVARENSEINGISDKTEFICGDLTKEVHGKYNVVCANIVADIIIMLSASIGEYMEDDACFICSGIIDIRRDEVYDALLRSDFEIIEEIHRDNWYAFVTRKVK